MVRIKRFNESNIFDGDFLVKAITHSDYMEWWENKETEVICVCAGVY